MKRVGVSGAAVLAVAVAGWLALSQSASAQKTKGKTRAASTHQLMEGFVSINCGALKKALDAEQTDWKEVSLRAALLNEAGYLLMDDGRCPDAQWAKAAKALQQHSAALLEKADAQDLEGSKAAFKELTGSGCAVCHEAHRPKK